MLHNNCDCVGGYIQCVTKKIAFRKSKVFCTINKKRVVYYGPHIFISLFVSLKIFTKEKRVCCWNSQRFTLLSDYTPTTFICQIKLHPKMSVYLCSIVNNLKKPKDTNVLEYDRKTSVWSKVLYVTSQRINRGRNKDYPVINWLFYVQIL